MIKSLKIKKFRSMVNMEIPLGKKITAIAGQNATCKSTLLGMIGQPFGLKDEKTIFNKSFLTKFSDVFKFSEAYDVPGEHEYEIEFYDEALFGKNIEHVKSFKRTDGKSHIRLVVGTSRAAGEGNLDYPVIYLGLKRAYPIGELKSMLESTSTLTAGERKKYKEWYEYIFCTQEEIRPIQISAKQQKDTLAVTTSTYDYKANSAGQDNIGQILGALLSFSRLKESKDIAYKGGIILIDEIDAMLFPGAQINLVDLLYNISGKLKIQFVFTTHSLDLLRYISSRIEKEKTADAKIIYLSRAYGDLELIVSPNMERIESDINMVILPSTPAQKINLYCEDNEAKLFLSSLLGRQLTKYINICSDTFGGDFLRTLAKKNISEFKNSLIILDGDKKIKPPIPNVIPLPGDGLNPENLFDLFLTNLLPLDEFWCENNLTKQAYLNARKEFVLSDRNQAKAWFNEERKNWGRGAAKLFNRWKKDNSKLVEKFQNDFIDAYNKIAKKKSIKPIQKQ